MQPPGFNDKSKPNHVCWLRKVTYGLKQAHRVWYSALKNALIQLDFLNFKVDYSLFIYRDASIICYFLVYIDNLVITRNDTSFVASVIIKLGNQFPLKDIDSLHLFLEVEVIQNRAGLFLSQHKYVHEFLQNTDMVGANDVSTPLSTSTPLHLLDRSWIWQHTVSLSHWQLTIPFTKPSRYLFHCEQATIIVHT